MNMFYNVNRICVSQNRVINERVKAVHSLSLISNPAFHPPPLRHTIMLLTQIKLLFLVDKSPMHMLGSQKVDIKFSLEMSSGNNLSMAKRSKDKWKTAFADK